MHLKLLVLTNLFPTPWDPLRGTFNRQQFERLGQSHDVHVLTAVDFRQWLRGVRGSVDVPGLRTDHFVFVFPPGIGRSLHAGCWLASLLLQHGRRLRAEKYDGILASWAYPDGVAAEWLARRLGIPCVIKVHGSDLNVMAEDAWRRPQIRSALRRAGAVVAVSRALADKAVAIGADPARVHVVYNGVDSTLFEPGSREQARSRLCLPPMQPMLLFVGNLKLAKGCVDLLEAFPAVLAAFPQAHLIYVGDGPCRRRIDERATALGCAERVQCVGAVGHASLAEWFRAADALCLPSHNEGVPNVVLEAMACGTPAVATRVGGIPEVLPDYAGILVPTHDLAALSRALIEASIKTWDPARIAAHARDFNWRGNIAQLDAILQRVATPSPGSSSGLA
jgi:glycosyltransferase involved in cell wall biosynthesis